MKLFFYSIIITFFLVSWGLPNVQETEWKGVYLTVAGQNERDSVQAYFKVSECNGEGVVLLKLINLSQNKIEAFWQPAVFTTEKKWINTDKKVSVILGPNSQIEGTCNNESTLVFKLKKEVGIGHETFNRYAMNYFNVIVNL